MKTKEFFFSTLAVDLSDGWTKIGDGVYFSVQLDDTTHTVHLLFSGSNRVGFGMPSRLNKYSRLWFNSKGIELWRSCNYLIQNTVLAYLEKQRILGNDYRLQISGYLGGSTLAVIAATELKNLCSCPIDIDVYRFKKPFFCPLHSYAENFHSFIEHKKTPFVEFLSSFLAR